MIKVTIENGLLHIIGTEQDIRALRALCNTALEHGQASTSGYARAGSLTVTVTPKEPSHVKKD